MVAHYARFLVQLEEKFQKAGPFTFGEKKGESVQGAKGLLSKKVDELFQKCRTISEGMAAEWKQAASLLDERKSKLAPFMKNPPDFDSCFATI